MREESITFDRVQIGRFVGELLNQPRYVEKPLSPPFTVRGVEVPDPVRVPNRVVLQVDSSQYPDLTKAAQNFNEPVLLLSDMSAPVKAVIQGLRRGFPVVEITVQPEKRN